MQRKLRLLKSYWAICFSSTYIYLTLLQKNSYRSWNLFRVCRNNIKSRTEAMIVYQFHNNLIYAYLLLTTLLHTVAALPFCTALYGVPDTASCNELLHGDDSYSGYTGIGNTDRRDHLFALPNTMRPPHTTDEQWYNKVNLSIIRANRKPISPSTQHLLSPSY